MPPPKKRSHAAANLQNVQETPSKRIRPTEPIVLSSDSELEVFEVPRATRDPAVSDDHSSQESQPRRSLSLFQQLQEEALSDLKIDIRIELDSLRPPSVKSEAPGKKTVSKERPKYDSVWNLGEVLRQWVNDKAARHADHFYYRLDHAYDERHFPPEAFSGRDAVVVETLRGIAEELQFEILFALLDRDDSDPTPDYLARRLVDHDGHELASDIPVDRKNWLQTSLPPLKARPPDAEVAVVLLPQDRLVNFVMQYAEGPATSARLCSFRAIEGFARYLVDRISKLDDCDRLFPSVKEFCSRAWQLHETGGLFVLPEEVVESLLKAVVHARDWEFLETIASHLGGHPPVGFFKWIAEQVASGELALPDIQKSLLAAAFTSTTPFDRVLAAHRCLPLRGVDSACKELLVQLIERVPDDLGRFGSCSHIGQLLVDLIYTTQGLDVLATKLLLLVEKHAAHSAFVLGVLRGLHCPTSDRPAFTSLPQGLFEQLSQLFIDGFDVSKFFQREPHIWQGRGCACAGPLSSKPPSSGATDAFELAEVISELLARDGDRVVARFAFKIVADVGLIPPRQFSSLWLPFLSHLIKVLEKRNVPLTTPRYHHLFAAVLETYLTRCVSVVPRKWAPKCRNIYCRPSCTICNLFNRFLMSNATAASLTKVSTSEMDHISKYLAPNAYKNFRSSFGSEDGVLVVRKQNDVDSQYKEVWREKTTKATLELDKSDGPALRTILGDEDYVRIRGLQVDPLPKPVPIESLEEPNGPRPIQTPRTPAPARSAALSSPAHQPVAPGCSSWSSYPRPEVPPMAGHTPPPSSYATGRVPATAPVKAESRLPGPLRTLAGLSSTRTTADAGYRLFADELAARLRKLSSFRTPESIQTAVVKRWMAMGQEERQHFSERAAKLAHTGSAAAPSPAVPFNPRHERQPVTPTPSPHETSSSVFLTPAQNLTALTPGQIAQWQRVGKRYGPPPPSTPTPPASAGAMQRASSSSRAFGSQVSSSRLNSVSAPQSHPKIKTEPVPRSAARPVRREPVEVIDLTGDD